MSEGDQHVFEFAAGDDAGPKGRAKTGRPGASEGGPGGRRRTGSRATEPGPAGSSPRGAGRRGKSHGGTRLRRRGTTRERRANQKGTHQECAPDRTSVVQSGAERTRPASGAPERRPGKAKGRGGKRGGRETGRHEQIREASRAWEIEQSASGRDIAREYPGPGNLERRGACARDLKRFCEVYFPAAFSLPWSPDHLRVIAALESAVLDGGLLAIAMPRGSGKTTLCERATLWALLYRHRRFVALIGATEQAAESMLEHLKTELQFNEPLVNDFRSACYPIGRLENNARRQIGQLFRGEQTRQIWSNKRVTFATMPDDVCDGLNVTGSTVTVAGLTGAIRGQSHTLASGEILRPELVILDDPQTRESAGSVAQCAERAEIVAGDVLGMAGPGRKIAAIMPCTVIHKNDLADEFLDRDKHPEWRGEKTQAVYVWPLNEKLWGKYHEIRADEFRRTGKTTEATEFYRANREAMDKGATVAWPERFNPDELSAIQHVENLRADLGPLSFSAEYQNDPIDVDEPSIEMLSVDEICAKLNGLARATAPLKAAYLTAFIDPHQKVLAWIVVAWEPDFTGYVIDYGTEPEQKTAAHFAFRDVRYTLAVKAPKAGFEGAIYAGLERLTQRILGREWQRDDGAMMRIDRCLIDANWGQATDVVYKFCRQSSFANIVTPSHGKYVGASSEPLNERATKKGDRMGLNWRMPAISGRRVVRHILFDTNYWKSFVHARLQMAMGDPGCLSLFGRSPQVHKMLAEHLTSEYPVRTEGRGRTVDEWKLRLKGADNHWFDGLVGCAVAASIVGVDLKAVENRKPVVDRKRVSYAELQRAARAKRA